MSRDVREEPLQSIIRNCQRLITDAEIILMKGGSAGSACSLAIIAYEEAGKGLSHELDAGPGNRIKLHSKHHYRHLIAAIVMLGSLQQKYNIKSRELTEKQQQAIKNKFESAKNFAEFASRPAPEEVRSILGEEFLQQIDALPRDERMIALIEFNWLRKMAKSSMVGDVEKLRQKGFYVDFNEEGTLSKPEEIDGMKAYEWIWIAKRAVNLLAFGIYFQPYSLLAAKLESMPKPLPNIEDIAEPIFEQYERHKDEISRGANVSTNGEIRPYEPFGEQTKR